ncbi:unnamed protein product [Soboliphyme baturini]|uniref:Vacuolar protein sorting-associated protein VTA1 homolog n=1 Tax=Soboliphyme baturini TaxID=241478 RepID=A0A183IDA9_9BILA|nr:unnamed protein product [Soboliphyme baturini]
MTALPEKYKSLGHYLKLSNEHIQRDPAVYYWSLFYLVQSAMQIDRKLPECIQFLSEKMKLLENLKVQLKNNETVLNEVVAQAHIEQYALKLFMFADNEDRASRFNKNTIKAFYTAGHLFDILTLFGELDDKLNETRKYAKWKAGYLFTCLKTGETPVPGPPTSESNETGVGTEKLVQAQKHCKYAISAMEYEDIPTAISNLENALLILKTHT